MRSRVWVDTTGELVTESPPVLAVAGSDPKRPSLRRLFCAIQPKLAMLDCADTAYRGNLVFRKNFNAAMVAQSSAWVRRWNRFFHGDV